jgi:hypothetical protein
MSHELVELFTDPELDAWYAGGSKAGEVGDAGVSSGNVKQTAWVNGAKVQAYWSNRHGATVIPIDRDYRARIVGAAIAQGSEVVERGSFRPDPKDQAMCSLIPACCLPNRDFYYEIVGHDEVVRLHLERERYRQPTFVWMIEGVTVSGAGTLRLNVFAQRFSGRQSRTGSVDVDIAYVVADATIELRALGEKMNFDVAVGCTVTDASFTGNIRVNVIATPSVQVGFSGAELVLDPEYVGMRNECNKAVAEMFGQVAHGGISKRPRPGEPVILDPGLLAELPAYTRVTQYKAARNVVLMTRMAAAVLPAETAQIYAMSLAADVPALSDLLAVRTDTC